MEDVIMGMEMGMELIDRLREIQTLQAQVQMQLAVRDALAQSSLSLERKRKIREQFREAQTVDISAIDAAIETAQAEEQSKLMEAKVSEPLELTRTTFDRIAAEARWLASPERQVEHFVALFVDQDGEVCGRYDESSGEKTRCTVAIDAVLDEAIRVNARGAWVAHNHLRDDQWDAQRGRHNAGACEPSAADKATTGALRGALAARGIVLLDSAICGPRALGFSFRHAESGPILSGAAAYEARQARAGAA